MQSGTSRRALSFLASKIHRDPLPLSPRESAQLLNLLTTSFRAHLDRAHPLADTENTSQLTPPQLTPPVRRVRNASPTRANSSQSSAREHIESILTNPLFARRPQRRASDASKANAQDVLQDPLGWFLDQVAIGAADLTKASTCLQMLQRKSMEAESESPNTVPIRIRPASQIAEWLRTSGLEHSAEFVTCDAEHLLKPLANMLVQEGEETLLWKWFTYSPKKRVQETGLEPAKITLFRARLLRAMVGSPVAHQPSIDHALAVFLRAYRMLHTPEYGLEAKTLRIAGFHIVNQILAHPQNNQSLELHEAFMNSSKKWTGKWARSVESMLWLHHPTSPTARPGVAYIRDPEGIASHLRNATSGRRNFLVHLCLQTARQSLAEQNYSDAQFVLEFARDTFPDLVGSQEQKRMERKLEEDRNLEMLDQLLPA